MSVEIISSFGLDGYREYGRQFVSSMEAYLPDSAKLIIYNEWEAPPSAAKIEYRNLNTLPDFAKSSAKLNTELFRGKVPNDRWKKSAIEAGYNFRFDAFKFFRKVLAIADAMERCKTNRLFWIDADTVALTYVDEKIFDELLPSNADISRLYRGEDYHSECGLIGYRVNALTKAFTKWFAQLYLTGQIAEFDEWHDSYVFDQLIALTPQLKIHNIPHTSRAQPFDNSAVGRYIIHLKGPRKDKGVDKLTRAQWDVRRKTL